VTIYNKKGDSLELTIRPARSDEAPQLIILLKKQYGTCYYDAMYDEEAVRHALETASLRVVVAELAEGGIIGIIGANSVNPFPGSLVFTMLVIDIRFRGFGLGKRLSRFLMDLIPPDAYTCIYGHIITLDALSQTTHYRFGYRMAGLLLNCYIYDREAEYMAGLPLPFKDSLMVACLPQRKMDAGTLYAASPHGVYIEAVYQELRVGYTLTIPGEVNPTAFRTGYTFHQDENHYYGELFVQEAGFDFSVILDRLLGQYAASGQTINAFVNLNDPACPYGVSVLEKQGFFFTGVQPLSGDYEYLILHYSRDLEVPFEQIAVIPEFLERFNYIQAQYKEARHVRKD
jgi:L-amino acid N-acyltransferase YncA